MGKRFGNPSQPISSFGEADFLEQEGESRAQEGRCRISASGLGMAWRGSTADGGGDGFTPGAGLVAGVHPAAEVVDGISGVRGIEGG
jgi:hypothetical protein